MQACLDCARPNVCRRAETCEETGVNDEVRVQTDRAELLITLVLAGAARQKELQADGNIEPSGDGTMVIYILID